jgi:Uma2 family endonuclease
VGGVLLEGVAWSTYVRLSRDLDRAGSKAQLVYIEGRLGIVSPRLPEHESVKKLVARFVELISLELDIPIRSLGESTWRRKKLGKGCEPDESYYIQHEPRIGGRTKINLKKDPPPDLIVEVEITNDPLEKFPVYAALGVPEIWHYDRTLLRCLHLARGGTYAEAEKSLAFPFLRPAEMSRFLDMLSSEGEHAVVRAFRDWVRALPR